MVPQRSVDVPAPPVLEALGVNKVYRTGGMQLIGSHPSITLENVNLAVPSSSILAIVGRSGSGKSTLCRCLALLEQPDSGEIRFRGANVVNLSSSELRRARRSIQLVWQHSALALNPRFRAVEIVAEPLQIQRVGSKRERHEQALTMMSKLGLSPALGSHKPHQLSGGQKQRVAIARALIVNPTVLIFDEALAGLDLPLQQQIAKLLLDLKRSRSLSYIFVFHDLRMAASLSDRVAVMESGRIVEVQMVEALFSSPQHSVTRQLINAIPPMPFSVNNGRANA